VDTLGTSRYLVNQTPHRRQRRPFLRQVDLFGGQFRTSREIATQYIEIKGYFISAPSVAHGRGGLDIAGRFLYKEEMIPSLIVT